MSTRSALVNRQFNTPTKLYSPDNLADTMVKQSQVLTNGAIGIDYNQKMAAPGNFANSAVLRMLEESERGGKENKITEHAKPRRRPQRFDWPPKGPDNISTTSIDEEDDDNNDYNNNIGCNKVVNGQRVGVRHHVFTTTIPIVTNPGLKRVAWPPPPENLINNFTQEPVYPKEPVFNSPISPTNNHNQQQAWSPNNPLSPQSQQRPANEPVFQTTYQTAAPVFEPPPTTVTLRQSAPVSQAPPPIFESQPAAKRVTGPRMRGDQKWPPAENKAQVEVEAAAENEARKALAKGPAFRPRAPKKDYSKFFAQHQLTNNYPGYRAPPGTQHYVEEGTSNF